MSDCLQTCTLSWYIISKQGQLSLPFFQLAQSRHLAVPEARVEPGTFWSPVWLATLHYQSCTHCELKCSCGCDAVDSQDDYGVSRVRRYERNASAVAGARRYAAEVTEQSQRSTAAHGGGSRYTSDVDRSQQRAWNRVSLVDEISTRHQRASDPVGWSLLNLASNDLPSSSSSSVWENSSYMLDLQRRRRRQLRIANLSGTNTESAGADQAESDRRQRWQRRFAELPWMREEIAGFSGSGADRTESPLPPLYVSDNARRLRRRRWMEDVSRMNTELDSLAEGNDDGRANRVESPYMQRLQRLRQPRTTSTVASSSSNSEGGADRGDSPPPSWQTQSLHGTQLSTNVQHSELTPSSLSRRHAAADVSQPAPSVPRPSLAGSVFHETSSLADVDLWSSSRRERDATSSSFAPVFMDDIENDAEEITSTGAEAGSTASIGGDTESIDADSDVRSTDFEMGSIGAEVMVSGSSGSGAEIGVVVDPPAVRSNPYESSDYGPSTSDLGAVPNSRNHSSYVLSRVSERLAEHVDLRERAPQRRWRRFNQADVPDRASHGLSSSAAASNGSMRISDWLEFELTGDTVPRRLPVAQGHDYSGEFSSWNSRDRDTSAASTSAASDVPRLRDFVAAHARRGRPSGSGAASNAALFCQPHECPPNCEVCGGGRAANMRRMRTNQYMSELARDRFPDNSTRTRPPLYDSLAPAASAVEDDESIVGSLAQLRQEIETTHSAVPAWREPSASAVDAGHSPFPFDSSRYPAAADFEHRVRRLDERVSQMRRRVSVLVDQAERDVTYLRYYRHRERQTEAQHSQYSSNPVADNLPPSRRNYGDGLLPSLSAPIVTGYGSTGVEAVSEFVNLGQ